MRIFLITGLLASFMVLAAQTSFAQSPTIPGASSGENAVEIPEDLTREDVRDLLSKLSDQQVRDILLKRLDAVAEEQEERRNNEKSILELMEEAIINVGLSIFAAIKTVPLIIEGISNGITAIGDGAGISGVMKFLVGMALGVGVGLGAAFLFDKLTENVRSQVVSSNQNSLGASVRFLFKRLVFDLLKVAAFAIAAFATVYFFFGYQPPLPLAWGLISNIGITTLILASVGRFNLAPNKPELRLMNMSDENAKQLYRYTVIAGFIIGVFIFVMSAREAMGIEMGVYRVGFWLNLILHGFFVYAMYMSREGISQALIGRDGLVGPVGVRLAHLWPYVAIFLAVLSWIVVEAIAGIGRFDLIDDGENYWMLLLIAFVPAFDTALRGLIAHLTPPPIGEGLIAERAHHATLACYVRAGRVILLGLLLLSIAAIWDISFFDADSDDFGTRFASQLLDGVLVFIIGYLLWEAVGISINRRLAKEHGDAGIDLNSEEPGGGEGGGTGLSRLATILPIAKLALQSTIIVMTILFGLSRLGVDTTPLLAGAGIVGLAIGFGAQTLVKDVVSGIFFLADDAFRVGEYLEIAGTVGTVERISIRSLQLRHHKGPVHTIPYGEIPQVTNNSRDWVIMKLKFTFPFETDPNRIKKIFKKVGAEMLEADYSDDLIQTFKSQGVYDVDDVGVVIRGKFMAKPGTQWVIRKDVYNRVQKALDAEGIQFARKEVRVQIPGMDGARPLTEDEQQVVGAAVAEAAQEPLTTAPKK